MSGTRRNKRVRATEARTMERPEILLPPAIDAGPGLTSAGGAPEGPVRVLLVEDDAGDALLVEELLSETDLKVELDRAMSVAEALPRLADADCVLLDLALPDAFGLEGLRTVLAGDSQAAVIVLTGLS
ncbi:MAG TPA: response regulator, partial [Acidimicrobiia bacterium]|nr:response regulator [Acidimicrobiia bacterium]